MLNGRANADIAAGRGFIARSARIEPLPACAIAFKERCRYRSTDAMPMVEARLIGRQECVRRHTVVGFIDAVQGLNSRISAITPTLKQALQSDSGAWMKITDHLCRQAHRHFMNLLNRAVFGAAFRRYGKRLRVLPVLEEGEVRTRTLRSWEFGKSGRWHIHCAIELPSHFDAIALEKLIRKCWARPCILGDNNDLQWRISISAARTRSPWLRILAYQRSALSLVLIR